MDTISAIVVAAAAMAAGFLSGAITDAIIGGLPRRFKKPQIEIDTPNGQKIMLRRSEVTPERVREITRSVARVG